MPKFSLKGISKLSSQHRQHSFKECTGKSSTNICIYGYLFIAIASDGYEDVSVQLFLFQQTALSAFQTLFKEPQLQSKLLYQFLRIKQSTILFLKELQYVFQSSFLVVVYCSSFIWQFSKSQHYFFLIYFMNQFCHTPRTEINNGMLIQREKNHGEHVGIREIILKDVK